MNPPAHNPPAPKHELREQWLMAAMPMLDTHFASAKFDVPENIRVSCGWPSSNAVGPKKRSIGQCWDSIVSEDSHFEIFISPCINDSLRVLDVLVHEVVHAVVGLKCGHKKPFAICAKAVGLVGPWTKTTASPELVSTLSEWHKKLGPYPHGKIDFTKSERPKETTRMLLMTCDECGCKIRTTAKWIDTYGTDWPCPCEAGRLIYDES